jgi:FKBP-type peptidyl-prolyl cis-trans isomerase SlyD
MPIQKHSLVAIEYRLTDNEGEEIDSSGEDGPLTYVHGMQEIIPGLEKALEGRNAGEQFQVTIEPEDAYGDRYEELCIEMPRDEFEDELELELGMQFNLTDEDGEEIVVTVIDFDEDSVVVDGNHPLAGVTLNFDVKIHEVRPATPEEIEESGSHSCDDEGCGCDHED